MKRVVPTDPGILSISNRLRELKDPFGLIYFGQEIADANLADLLALPLLDVTADSAFLVRPKPTAFGRATL